ncbi:MAG: DUF4365 domain-containing protein [Anaerolineales bacterium]|nr:DUF4365 domain-containing protein [Anaerolineales bacterium]
MTGRLPKRTRAHDLEALSRQYMERIFSPPWICRDVSADYGLDMHVEIVADGQVTGREFSVQIKGTDRLKTSGTDVIHRCKVSTARYFLQRSELVMYVVYDAEEETAYWVWMQHYLLSRAHSGWLGQQTVLIRIPLARRLTAESLPAIADDVEAWQERVELILNWPGAAITAFGGFLVGLVVSGAKALISRRRRDAERLPEPVILAIAAEQGRTERPPNAQDITLLRRFLTEKRAKEAELKALAAALGCQPLAMELAGRYLACHRRLKVTRYLQNLEAIRAHPAVEDLRGSLGDTSTLDVNLLTSFALNWTDVTDEAARRLFALAGWCAPGRPIPRELLQVAVGLDHKACDEALSVLTGLGLLQTEDLEADPVIHPLLAEYARHQAMMTDPLPSLVEKLVVLADQANATGRPDRFEALLPHVQKVTSALYEAAPSIRSERQMEKARTLWRMLGLHYDSIADYAQAVAVYERALKIDHMVSDTASVAADLDHLARAWAELGHFSKARMCAEESLKLAERLELPMQVASSMNTLGLIHVREGEPRLARDYCEQALHSFRHLGELSGIGLTCITLSETLRHLSATDDLDRGAALLQQAAEYAQEAAEIFTRLVSERPRVVESFRELGCVYRQWAWLRRRHNQFDTDPEIASLVEKSEQALQRAIDEGDHDLLCHGVDAQVELAWLYYFDGKNEQARSKVLNAINRLPEDYHIREGIGAPDRSLSQKIYWVLLGKAHLLMGQIACREFHQASNCIKHLEETARCYTLALAYYDLFASGCRDMHWAQERIVNCLQGLNTHEEVFVIRDGYLQTVDRYALEVSTFMEDVLRLYGH